ncbi:MAG: hypothetical protein ACKVS8_02025 [Phycisphaerales bacterium]
MNSALNIAKLLVICEQIEGRKKLQKLVHILQSTGHERDFPQQFGYLHYGPYSHGVKADIDLLVDPDGPLASETEEVSGMGHKTFVYRPSPELVEALSAPGEPAWADKAKRLNQKTAQETEAMSTILFLKRSGVAEEALAARFKQLKPALADRYATALNDVKALC